MANIKIAQLNNKLTLADTDILLVESATATEKMTVANLKELLNIQSGGIIQSGSNANGRFIYYADGTLIMYGSFSVSLTTSLQEFIINFPNGFFDVDTPVFTAVGRPSSEWDGFGIIGHNVAAVAAGRITIKGTPTQTITGKWQAIGRWKA